MGAGTQDNFWMSTYANAAETRRRLDSEYVELRQVLGELGMAKVK